MLLLYYNFTRNFVIIIQLYKKLIFNKSIIEFLFCTDLDIVYKVIAIGRTQGSMILTSLFNIIDMYNHENVWQLLKNL